MNFFKEMDLYKGIILLSVVLLPLGGWWISSLDEQIVLCETARYQATRRGGFLEDIGKYQGQIGIVASNRVSKTVEDPRTYFEGQILAVSPDLKPDDFSPKEMTSGSTSRGRGRQRWVDKVWSIDWGKQRDRKDVKMDFVYAVLFNCESGAGAGGVARGAPSVWRLHKLELVNSAGTDFRRSKKTPPAELEDRWKIQHMEFARREPAQK